MTHSSTIQPQQAVPVSGVPRRPRPLSGRLAWAAGWCLVLPAAANTAFHLLTPVTSASTAGAVAQAAAHPALAQVAALQLMLPLLAAGVAVLAWRASSATPRLATWAGIFLAGGYLLGGLDSVSNLLTAIAPRFIGTAAAARLVTGYGHTTAGHFAALAIIGQGPGLIMMGIALWRSRIVPRWLAGAFLLTLPLQFVTHSGDGDRLPGLSWGWYTLVLAACAWYLIRAARDVPAGTGSETGLSWPGAAEQGTIAE
jgi:hypothetical protein